MLHVCGTSELPLVSGVHRSTVHHFIGPGSATPTLLTYLAHLRTQLPLPPVQLVFTSSTHTHTRVFVFLFFNPPSLFHVFVGTIWSEESVSRCEQTPSSSLRFLPSTHTPSSKLGALNWDTGTGSQRASGRNQRDESAARLLAPLAPAGRWLL